MIDLKDRVCLTLLQAGVHGPNGELPVCCGKEICSNWEQCLLAILEGQQDIKDMLEHPDQRRERGGSRR